MTPITLIHDLAARIRRVTADMRLEESDGDHVMRAPNVWTQHAPSKLYEDMQDPADYPLVIVMLAGGNGVQDGKSPCHVAILVGGYDEGQPLPGGERDMQEQPVALDRQGWTLPAAIIWRILTDLTSNPNLGPFALDLASLSWELPIQDQPEPQWFGSLNMTWSLPVPTRDYHLDRMDSYQDMPDTTFMEGM